MKSPRLAALALWFAVLAGCIAVIVQTRFVADMTAFMPNSPNARQQLLVDQLRDGAIARLVLMGIEGGDAVQRAQLSIQFSKALRDSNLFVGVQNGEAQSQARDSAYVFDNRYLLSPNVNPERFSQAGLEAAISDTIVSLSGNAGLMTKRLLPQDPTGETLALLAQLAGNQQPHSLEGVWASQDGKRALLLAYTRAQGSDTQAQADTIAAIQRLFKQSVGEKTSLKLVMSGAGVFSVSSRDTIEGEVHRLAAASLILVMGLLLLVYRSFKLLALGLLPVLSGVLVGIAVVSIGFGSVHGLTLGFGTTLIGEAVDYAIYFFIQRNNATPVFWRTIWLGVCTSIAGFAALLFSGFSGLAQLGLYSISGLIAAVLVTRYVLPILTPQNIQLYDLSKVGVLLEDSIQRLYRLRWLALIISVVAACSITLHQGDVWNRQLSALSPVSKSDQNLDLALRQDMGANDMRYVVAFTAKDQESALQLAEHAGQALQKLTLDGVIEGFNSPAFFLPSLSQQKMRLASLPNPETLQSQLELAVKDLPIKSTQLAGFLSDVARARQQPVLTLTQLDGTSMALLIDSMLIKRSNDYLVLMPLQAKQDEIQVEAVHSAFKQAKLEQLVVIDLLEESTSLFDEYRNEALLLSGIGCAVIALLLLLALRDVLRTLRILLPLSCAVCCTTAIILGMGTSLTILHLIGLLLVVAIGSNYALFFDRGSQSGNAGERRLAQVSLLVANLTAVGSFGLLGFSNVPVLSAIGCTVGIGTFLALVFSAMLTRESQYA